MNTIKTEEKSKGISLRKKRTVKPKISAPKQISGPLPTGATDPIERARRAGPAAPIPAVPRPRERTPNNDRTADLVKRRYSTRFTNLPQDFNVGAPPLPAVPKLPGQFAAQLPSEDTRVARGPRLQVDANSLSDPDLTAEQYVSTILADASEEDVENFQQDLRTFKNHTSTDLQHNVFQNRTQFIKISKEAEKLKGEMRTLRNLMSELTGALGQATSAGAGAGADTAKARRIANRSSVANLEALWTTHLQTLWKRVEGSQKYLPAVPGRHVVYESSRWVELNAATWRPRRRVHLILLNDHLLVASEKKKADTGPNGRDAREKQGPPQLAAVRCWPLQDVQMADLSTRSAPSGGSKANSSNAINVRVGTDSFTYATGSNEAAEKMTLLTTFRRTVEDLRKTMEADSQQGEKTRDSIGYLAARDNTLLRSPDLLDAINETSLPRSDLLVDVDGKPQSIRWVVAQIDDLDIDIALQRFEIAVARMEKLRKIAKGMKGNSVAQNIVTVKLNERAAKLATVITKCLKESHAWKTSTRRNVNWLVRLDFEDRARQAYLEARTDIIKKRSRQVTFEGDLHLYIYQVSYIYFTLIKDTALTFQICFPLVMMSACVKWAKEHVDAFNEILERQLSSVPRGSETWKLCVERAKTHAAVLGEAGLDFRGLVGVSGGDGGL